ncbi:MAG: inorganic phosphate transporter, partial [Methanospirillum sp.]|uniref:inorganic phosphate transporter n=1 Tax=Methanospirillum sp. TaxID=45200 RepID=UPI00236AAA86
MEPVLIFGIAVALCYNFINGLHDAANSIATVVATRVLTPVRAICLAAFFNLLGPLILTTAIAETISRGVFIPDYLTLEVVIIGVICASLWTLFTAYVGLPVSSVHSLVGGLVGSAIAYGGVSVVILPNFSVVVQIIELAVIGMVCGAGIMYLLAYWFKDENPNQYMPIGAFFGFILIIPAAIALHYLVISGILKIILFIVISPCLGFLIAFLLGALVTRLFRNANASSTNGIFNKLQIVSASFYSLGHGSNDGQNAMGVITTMLVL